MTGLLPERRFVSCKTLFSVHNALEVDPTPIEHFELNPAVVTAPGAEKYAVSVVCVGPCLTPEGQPLSLCLSVGDKAVESRSLHVRSEPTGEADTYLTVALFESSHRLLTDLASAEYVDVRLRGVDHDLSCPLGSENRRNVQSFLAQPALARHRRGDRQLSVESIAV